MKVEYIKCSCVTANVLACRLIARSCWFQVLPLPFDVYEVTTKAEGHLKAVVIPALAKKIEVREA